MRELKRALIMSIFVFILNFGSYLWLEFKKEKTYNDIFLAGTNFALAIIDVILIAISIKRIIEERKQDNEEDNN